MVKWLVNQCGGDFVRFCNKVILRAGFVEHLHAKVEQRNVCICVKCLRVEAVSMDDLSRKKRVREGHRISATKPVTKIVEAIANASTESPDKVVVWLRQSRATLRDKVKTIKELDTQIVDMLSTSKEENVDDQVVKEIEESDEVPLLTPTETKAAG